MVDFLRIPFSQFSNKLWSTQMEVDRSDSRVVLPGDIIHETSAHPENTKLILGPGTRQDGEQIVAAKAGILNGSETGNKWWIESNQKRVCILGVTMLISLN